MSLVIRRHRPRRLAHLLGLVLTTFALAALFWAGALAWQRFTAPPALARLLPAGTTLAYCELNLAHAEADNLLRPFAGADPAQLLELDFPLPAGFWNSVNRQVGVAFLGSKFDPENAVLLVHAADKAALHALLAGTALPTEELAEQPTNETLFAPKIYSLPQSGTLVFAWRGDTLLLAHTADSLRQAFSAGPRVADTPEYAAVIQRVNPRALGFGYLASTFAHDLAAGTAAGLRRALVRPVADSFTAAGFNLEATTAGLQLQFFTPLAPSVARAWPITEVAETKAADFTPLLGPEVTAFVAGHGAATFLSELTKFSPALATIGPLAADTTEQLTRQLLGAGATFASDLAPLWARDFAVGATATGGYFALANPPAAAQLLTQLQTELAAGTGWLAAATPRTLPDGTRSAERVAGTVTTTTVQISGENVTQLTAGDRQIWLANADGLLLLTTEKTTFETLLTRLNQPTASTLPAARAAAAFPGSARFFTRLQSTEPLLAPFHFLWLAPRWLPGEGLAGTLFLGA